MLRSFHHHYPTYLPRTIKKSAESATAFAHIGHISHCSPYVQREIAAKTAKNLPPSPVIPRHIPSFPPPNRTNRPFRPLVGQTFLSALQISAESATPPVPPASRWQLQQLPSAHNRPFRPLRPPHLIHPKEQHP
ncbi:MAG: hypothetical protein OJF49_004109 [Ktedonobacterales bacterium]|nr:MAG: hypothetical protein OJF49_004109 [Ktedonobacterales bacterium]